MIRSIQTFRHNIADSLRKHPRRYAVLEVLLALVVIGLAVLWPRTVEFSYAGKTCFYQPTLAPGLLRSQSESFRLEAQQRLVVGDITVAAASMCIVPLKAPQPGVATASLSLLGIDPLQKTYTVRTPAPPTITADLSKAPLPLSRALTVPLTTKDTIFSYKIAAPSADAPCLVEGVQLRCDVPRLKLSQGATYPLRVERYFDGKKVATVATHTVTTLTATAVTGASLKDGETVYAKPKTVELTTDKDIASATVRLVQTGPKERLEVATKSVHASNKLTVSWDKDLDRQASYELIVDKIIGADGSGLDGAHTLRFATSGGPKVKAVSVGSYKVPVGATATITFDQPLNEAQDLAGVVTASGGAVVTGKRANQVTVSFAGVPRCGDVKLSVTDALRSNYDIVGGSAWQYSTRTLCQMVSSIGTSEKGRPITSYTFGNGPGVVVYTGAIHGNEVSTRLLMMRWIDALEARPGLVPSNKTVVVIPAVNPDGIAAGSRTNARNVDLNRNFATADWQRDITTTSNAPFPGGGGASALSEPESRALAQYVSRVRPQLVLSYHSVGALVAANQAGDSSVRASTYARLSGYRNTTGSSDTFEYGISGTADDYYGQVLGVPSVLIELGSHTSDQFSRNSDAMAAMLK